MKQALLQGFKNVLKPLQINSLTFPNNLIQGPLAGVSLSPFRRLIWRLSRPAFCYTEMVSCKTIVYQRAFAKKRFLHIDADEGPVCLQLSAHAIPDVIEAVKIVSDLGFSLIDLNCGCPVKKIRQKKAGSALLSDPRHLYQLFIAMKNNTHLPIGVKIRVDGASSDGFNFEIAKAIQDASLDFVVVHGRHWTEQYESPCRYDEIAFFVNSLTIPVIGNGDVACLNTLHNMFATGCSGAMIARAGVGQPWLIKALKASYAQDEFNQPNYKEIGALFIEHVEGLQSILGNEAFAIFHARKLAKYYARTLLRKNDFCLAMNICQTFKGFIQLCEEYFSYA